jgi:transposase-like protein
MAEAYPFEDRLQARGCYVVDGMTYEQVAGVSGISVSQLKKWGSDEGWVARRKAYREAQASIREDTVLLRAELLKNALATKDAQDVYAVAAMEKIAIALDKVHPGTMGALPVDIPDMEFSGPEEMVDALWGVIEQRAAGMIHAPDTMDFRQIQAGLKSWLDLKRRYADTAKPDKGFKFEELDEGAKQAIKDIYGVS